MLRCNFRAIVHLDIPAKSGGLFRLFFAATSRLLCSIFCDLLNDPERLKERILGGIARMAGQMGALELSRDDAGVLLGCGQVGVSHHGLDVADSCAALQHVDGKAVTEVTRMTVLLEMCSGRVPSHHAPELMELQRLAGCKVIKQCSALLQAVYILDVTVQPVQRHSADGNHTVLFVFAHQHADRSIGKADVGQLQPTDLSAPQA